MPSPKGHRLPAHGRARGPTSWDDIHDFNKPLAGHLGDVCRIMPEQLLRMNRDLVFRLAAAPSLRRSQHPRV
jgi:hypothetical protein